MPIQRKIIEIDEEKCDGCGLCVTACAEGAIQIIDGKARVVNDAFCDGLGACIGECPQGALTIVEREAAAFDPEAVKRRQTSMDSQKEAHKAAHPERFACGCPGSASRVLEPKSASETPEVGKISSRLGNWPVQLNLVPIRAPYFQGARLLIAADCTPFAYADFHRRFIAGKTLIVGCPKLDDAELYLRKLTQIFMENDIESVEVVHMEVPCCFGLIHLVRAALEGSGKEIPLTITKIGIRGEICESRGPGAHENVKEQAVL